MSQIQILEKDGSEVTMLNEVVIKLIEQLIKEVDGASLYNIENAGIKNPFAKSIKIDFIENKVSISVNIVVNYGNRFQEIAKEVQEKVTQEIEILTGIEVSEVNVTIVSVI